MVYSESGGVSKTTTAVSLAMVAAEDMGLRTVLVDLDPRAAATKWTGVEPVEPGLHIGAILASEEPTGGYAQELAVPTHVGAAGSREPRWSSNLRVIPSARSVSNREADRSDHAELRLSASLEGLEADLVVIDCPNRQGGPLTLSALNAADTVIYAAQATADGIDGYLGARESVQKFVAARKQMGAPTNIREAGIIVSGIRETIISNIAKEAIADFEATGQLLYPLVPNRVVVQEVRLAEDWYGNYPKGEPVVTAYRELARKVIR